MFRYSQYVWEMGYREGYVEGFAKGYAEASGESLIEGKALLTKRMMRTKSWDAQKAMEELLIPEGERERVLACLKQMR